LNNTVLYAVEDRYATVMIHPTPKGLNKTLGLMLKTITVGNTGHVFATGAGFGYSFALNSLALTLCFIGAGDE
jgi:hypothetical protein